MDQNDLKQKLPGYIAAGLLIITTALWTLWGTYVMYYEGWGSTSVSYTHLTLPTTPYV